jgi:hypothetical protein
MMIHTDGDTRHGTNVCRYCGAEQRRFRCHPTDGSGSIELLSAARQSGFTGAVRLLLMELAVRHGGWLDELADVCERSEDWVRHQVISLALPYEIREAP